MVIQVEPAQRRAVATAPAGEAAFPREVAGYADVEVATVRAQAVSAEAVAESLVAVVELLVLEAGCFDVVALPDAAEPQFQLGSHQRSMAPCNKKHQAT